MVSLAYFHSFIIQLYVWHNYKMLKKIIIYDKENYQIYIWEAGTTDLFISFLCKMIVCLDLCNIHTALYVFFNQIFYVRLDAINLYIMTSLIVWWIMLLALEHWNSCFNHFPSSSHRHGYSFWMQNAIAREHLESSSKYNPAVYLSHMFKGSILYYF